MDFKEKNHSEHGCHYLSGTDKSPVGMYYGFIVTSPDTVINNITIIDTVTNSGDITSLTMTPGIYYPVNGGFSDITLSAGDMILLKMKR